jgi:hypothetical protein
VGQRSHRNRSLVRFLMTLVPSLLWCQQNNLLFPHACWHHMMGLMAGSGLDSWTAHAGRDQVNNKKKTLAQPSFSNYFLLTWAKFSSFLWELV